jgi:creatinine amidohydrolase
MIGLEVKNVSWDVVQKRQNKDSIVVIPLGAEAKEHGLHLPLNNDYVMAEHFKNCAR